MKRFHFLLMLVIAFSMTAFAQNAPKGQMLKYNGMLKQAKHAMFMAPNRADVPETAVVETDWALTGSYIYQSSPFENTNEIAVAFDGNDVYVKGMVFLCPEAWIKGTIDGTTCTFANGQYAGTYGESMIYACGTTDAESLSDITFDYDADAQTFTLTNYYLENTNTDAFAFYFYSFDLVLAKAIPAAATPTNVAVEPTGKTAKVAWTENGEATSWNLRYRNIPAVQNFFWDFEDESQVDGWQLVDMDADGNNWFWTNSKVNTHGGSGAIVSESYSNTTGVLNPDNWLVTPQVNMGGTASFWYCGQDPSYPGEVFAVYVAPVEEITSIDDFIKIGDDVTATGEFQEFTIDLSAYQGKGYIAIRHYNVSDKFWLNIDDFRVETPGGEYAGEWQVIEGVTENPYTIEGLTPETNYQVQVQAIGQINSKWSQVVNFSTIRDLYILGEVNEQGWAPNAGTMMAYDAEKKVYTATVTLDGRNSGYNYFSFTTELAENDDQGAWDYIAPFRIGAGSEGTTDFDVTPELMGVPLDLIAGGQNAFMVPAGEYNLTVDLASMKLVVEKPAPAFLRGDVDNNGEVKIADVTALINYLLSGDDSEINLLAADCDQNNEIKIGDVTALINYLLSGSWE